MKMLPFLPKLHLDILLTIWVQWQIVATSSSSVYRPLLHACAGYLSSYLPSHVSYFPPIKISLFLDLACVLEVCHFHIYDLDLNPEFIHLIFKKCNLPFDDDKINLP